MLRGQWKITIRSAAAVILLALLSACNSSTGLLLTPEPGPRPASPTPSPSPVQNLPEAEDQVPLTAVPLPDAYPAQVQPLPTRTLPANYPAPPTRLPPTEAYPGGLAWITRPVGVQCEEGTAPGYGDLSEAEATLTAAGIEVRSAEVIERLVTAVCGAPTSAHFRVQIAAENIDSAMSLGWNLEGQTDQ